MKNFSLSTKNKMIIFAAATAVAAIGIAYFLIVPTISDILAINQKIINEKEDLELKYQKGQFLKKVYEDFKGSEEERKIIGNAMINEKDLLLFITEIEKFSSLRGIEMDENIIQGEADKDSEDKNMGITIQMNGSGDYIQILKFLADIEMMKYYFNTTGILITSSPSRPGGVEAEITGKIYFYETKNTPS